MIVYPGSFVLSQAAATPSLLYPRVLYDNVLRALTAANITVSGETATGPRDAPLNPGTASYWEPPTVPATWTVDMLTQTSIDSVGLAGHNLASAGAGVEVRVSEDSDFNSHVALPGTNGNRVSTPDAAVFDITGNLEICVGVALADWSPAAEQALLSKWVATGNQRSYQLTVNTAGNLILRTTANGSTIRTHTSSVAVTGLLADGQPTYILGSRSSTTGTVKFYLGPSPSGPWTQLGADVAGTIEGVHSGTAPVELGASDAGTTLPAAGRFYYADVRAAIGGGAMERFYPDDGTNGASTVTSTYTGVVWTINTTGSPAAALKVRRFSVAVSPADDKPLLFLDTARTARYIRLTVTGAVARIPVVFAGVSMVMPKRLNGPHRPVNKARVVDLNSQMARGGQFAAQSVRRRGVKTDVTFKDIESAFFDATFDRFAESALTTPYFFAWNPLERAQEIAYVWTRQPIVPSYNGILNLMDVGWDIEGIG